jgi:hypothetical protein
MNARALGKNRDQSIIELVNECKFISRDQVQALVFGHKYRQKCCERLTKLHKAKQLKRKRVNVTAPYVYFPTEASWNQKYEHCLILNWVYIAMKQQMKSWFVWHVFKREYYCEWEAAHLLADALVVLKNTVRKRLHPVFVEIDRGTSNNKFDKVGLYTDYYRSKAWVHQWWAQPDEQGRYRFPKVLVVTDRAEQVSKIIERDNAAGIRFSVATLEDVQRDVYIYIL